MWRGLLRKEEREYEMEFGPEELRLVGGVGNAETNL